MSNHLSAISALLGATPRELAVGARVRLSKHADCQGCDERFGHGQTATVTTMRESDDKCLVQIDGRCMCSPNCIIKELLVHRGCLELL